MMRFVHKFSNSITKRGVGSSILWVSLYSTRRRANLYERLQKSDQDRDSVIPILDKWVAQGREIRQQKLERFIANFRKNRRFAPALDIAEWMSRSKTRFAITPAFVAVHIDLLSKVRGLKHVEKYFNTLEDGLVDLPVYTALMNCYAEAKHLEKAEATMKSIRRFDPLTALPYNIMLRLYSSKQKHENLHALIQEMQDRSIVYDKITYKILLETYANSDLEQMEKLLVKMESDGGVTVDFYSYATAAKGYLNARAPGKAFELLKKGQSLIAVHERSSVYLSLISWYATMQKTEDVYRVWDLLMNFGKLRNDAYVCMISSLAKMDDIDGAAKILGEWEARTTTFDIQIPNIVIRAYCKKGNMGDAEVIVKRLIDSAHELNAQTWSHMAFGYFKDGRMEKAVEMEKKALTANLQGWKPNLVVVAACLEYLQSKGDTVGMQEILVLVEKFGSSLEGMKELIERFFISGKPIAVTDYFIPFFTATVGRK